jgi:hypothetical protein
MPEPYTPDGSQTTFTVPSLDDYADGPQAFRDFADSIPEGLSAAIPVHTHASDCVLGLDDEGAACIVDCSDTKITNYTVTVPSSKAVDFPIGTAVVVGNVGTNRKATVTIVPGPDVIIRDTAVRKVSNNRMVVLLKVAQDQWLINAGAGGPSPGAVPSPPKLTAADPGPASVKLSWEAPADDGGHPLTLYSVEQSTDGTTWTSAGSTLPSERSKDVTGLKTGTEYQFRVLAGNMVGLSDPSNVLKGTPKSPFNDAAGGDVTYYSKDNKFYKVHTFKASSNLVVNNATALPWRVLVVAGGGGGGGRAGNNAQGIVGGAGGAGGALEKLISLPAGTQPVGVGTGGGGGSNSRGGQGGNSSVGDVVATGGGGGGCQYQGGGGQENGGNGGSGGGGQCASQFGARGAGGQGITGQGTNGAGGGEQGSMAQGGGIALKTDITGTMMTVSPGSYGSGGAGRGWDSNGNPGASGVVIVSYEVGEIPKSEVLLSEEAWRERAAREAGEA